MQTKRTAIMAALLLFLVISAVTTAADANSSSDEQFEDITILRTAFDAVNNSGIYTQAVPEDKQKEESRSEGDPEDDGASNGAVNSPPTSSLSNTTSSSMSYSHEASENHNSTVTAIPTDADSNENSSEPSNDRDDRPLGDGKNEKNDKNSKNSENGEKTEISDTPTVSTTTEATPPSPSNSGGTIAIILLMILLAACALYVCTRSRFGPRRSPRSPDGDRFAVPMRRSSHSDYMAPNSKEVFESDRASDEWNPTKRDTELGHVEVEVLAEPALLSHARDQSHAGGTVHHTRRGKMQ